MVELFAGSSGMAIANQLTPRPPRACAEGADRGQCCRVLYNCANRPRKKLVSELIDLILVFLPLPTQLPPKGWNHASPTFPPQSNLLVFLSSITPMCFWLVIAFKI
jgi:hypothetical protein